MAPKYVALTRRKKESRTIVLGVTDSLSVQLLGSLPEMLVQHGWDVSIFVSRRGQELNLPGKVRVFDIPLRRSPNFLMDLRAFFRILSLLIPLRPGVVFFGTPKISLLGLAAAAVTRVPTRIYILRGLRSEASRGLFGWFLRLAELVTAACSTSIIPVSKSLQEKYIKEGFAARSKVSLLGLGSSHGVNLQRFQRPKPASSVQISELESLRVRGVLLVGFVGRFSRDKGSSALVSCKRHLFESGVDCVFVVLGPLESGNKEWEDLDRFGRPAIKLPGDTKVEELYSRLDLLLLPSIREGFPNVVLEAAAAGVPAVVFDSTGSRDAVKHFETGIQVPLGDENLFSLGVELLLTEPKLRKALGREASKWVARHFDERDVIANHVKFIEGLS